jgi:hypothetical protein
VGLGEGSIKMETNIDCMKYRKSTHLASIDVDAIIAEKGSCELTIKLAFYDKGVDVSGNKTDGYFLRFEEAGIKDMVVNSGNRKKISSIIKELKGCTPVESRNLTNWVGLKIGLKVDPNVKMMGQVVGGIIVDLQYKSAPKKTLEQAKADFAKVTSRETFVNAMNENSDFMQNAEIIAECKKLAVTYQKPEVK